MTFALPLTVGLLLVGFVFLNWRVGKEEPPHWKFTIENSSDERGRKGLGLIIVFAGAVVLWLSEPLHGIPAAVVALGTAASLFVFRLLGKKDLARIDWSTLLLIAGGITLGRLLENVRACFIRRGGAFARRNASWYDTVYPLLRECHALCLDEQHRDGVLLIPLASLLMPQPSTAILIAISASFGMPFVISTPPNAMAHGEGGLRTSDLLYLGLIQMLLGCAVVSVTGRAVLNFVGIP
jgi:sodium-dependent dicarboxylate transporter 2/3/5